jgi:hypothetical protein
VECALDDTGGGNEVGVVVVAFSGCADSTLETQQDVLVVGSESVTVCLQVSEVEEVHSEDLVGFVVVINDESF